MSPSKPEGLTSEISSKTLLNYIQSSHHVTRQLCVRNVMKIGSEMTEESAKFSLVDEFNVNLTIYMLYNSV